ncbi:MAG: flagella basal body P-ring formation protein FlgA [Sphingomonadaceae bacterium]|nr:flagella basal body P-ring formation protein FlgA [Sphingomonadaceae bacterium]
MTLFRRLILPALALAAPVAASTAYEDLDRLEARVVAAVGAGIGEPGGPQRPIDRRLRLAACPSAPMVTMPMTGAATLDCEALGWRIHVPLARTAIAGPGDSGAAAREKVEPVIRKGDQVEVVAMGGMFTVSTIAVAQQDGAPGDRIRLKGDGKAAPFFAQVEAPGRVVVSRFN